MRLSLYDNRDTAVSIDLDPWLHGPKSNLQHHELGIQHSQVQCRFVR